MTRICLPILFFVSTWLATFVAEARSQVVRDWTLHPAVVEIQAPETLYALGDVHGDYDRLVPLLAAAHLIAPVPAAATAVRWTGGNAVLVCTGDMIDKFNQGMEVIALLRALQPQAIAGGGRVVVTIGNHEADFLAASGADNKAADFETELEAAGLSPNRVAAGKDSAGIGTWLRDLPIAAKVGDWFFCHAGDTNGLTVAQLNEQAQAQITEHGFGCPILGGEHSLIEARMHPRPWWDWDGQAPSIKLATSGPATADADPGQTRLRAGIEALGAHHLVFGHQPGKILFSDRSERAAGEMVEKFDGLVFLIDTGMSRGVASGRGAVLQISHGSPHGATAIYADGSSQELFK